MTKWAQVIGGYHLSIRKCPNFIKMSNVQQLIVTCISMFFAQRRKQNIAFSSHFIVFYTIAYTQEYDYLKEEWAYLYPGNLQNCKFQKADERGDRFCQKIWSYLAVFKVCMSQGGYNQNFTIYSLPIADIIKFTAWQMITS